MGDKPKALIETLSESLLKTFRAVPLLDAYDVYQHLMDYWAATMQDDAYLLAREGWMAVLDGKPNIDLIPPSLIVARYFAAEQEALDRLETAQETIASEIDEFEEEQGGEDGLLTDARNEKDNLTAKSVKERLKGIECDRNATEERAIGALSCTRSIRCKLSRGLNRPPSGAVLRRRQHRIPDGGRTSIFEVQLAEVELTLVDPAQQFNAGTRGRRGREPLEPEHWTDA